MKFKEGTRVTQFINFITNSIMLFTFTFSLNLITNLPLRSSFHLISFAVVVFVTKHQNKHNEKKTEIFRAKSGEKNKLN
jgi:hypothetical protein